MTCIVVENINTVRAIVALQGAGVALYIPDGLMEGPPDGVVGPFRTLDEVECWWEDK